MTVATVWLDAKEAGAYVHLSASSVRRAAAAGELTGSYLKGRWLFRTKDLDAWVMRHANRGVDARHVGSSR